MTLDAALLDQFLCTILIAPEQQSGKRHEGDQHNEGASEGNSSFHGHFDTPFLEQPLTSTLSAATRGHLRYPVR